MMTIFYYYYFYEDYYYLYLLHCDFFHFFTLLLITIIIDFNYLSNDEEYIIGKKTRINNITSLREFNIVNI